MAIHHTKAKQMKRLESKLGVAKVDAVHMLIAKESRMVADGEPKNDEQIAERLKINPATLYNWKKNEDFITYKNLIADTYLEEKRSIVNEKLMSLIDSSQPSVKAIDLYFRRFGLLTERQIVEQIESQEASASNEKIEDSIAELDELLDETEGK